MIRTLELELLPGAGSPFTSVPDTVAVSVVTCPGGTAIAERLRVTT